MEPWNGRGDKLDYPRRSAAANSYRSTPSQDQRCGFPVQLPEESERL